MLYRKEYGFLSRRKIHFRRSKYPPSDRFVSAAMTYVLFLLIILYNKPYRFWNPFEIV